MVAQGHETGERERQALDPGRLAPKCACVPSGSVVPDSCNPMDCMYPPGLSVHGILQAGILECIVISSSGGSYRPRDGTLLCLLHWQTDSLPLHHPGSPGSRALNLKAVGRRASSHPCARVKLPGSLRQDPAPGRLVGAGLFSELLSLSPGVDPEKPLLGFEEFSPEMSGSISALLPPQGWGCMSPSRLAHGRSTVAFDGACHCVLSACFPPLSPHLSWLLFELYTLSPV